nr:microtubule-associated protein RP/EB family member 1C [Ipomoea batatas]
MVMKMTEGAFGLDAIPCEMSVAVGNDEETTGGTAYLRKPAEVVAKQWLEYALYRNIKKKLKLRVNGGGEERQLRERGDGWMEIEQGEFFTGEENEGEVTMRLTEREISQQRNGVVMMDSAYFIGRSEILSWINSTLHLNLSKVEEAFTGAVPCQLMDAAHPGMVPMHKVNFDAKNDYNALERREACKGGREANKKSAAPQPSAETAATSTKHAPHNGRMNAVTNTSSTTNPSGKTSRPSSSGGRSVYSETEKAAHEQQITELKLSIDSLEDIEIVCQCPEIENLLVVEAIKRILYATDADGSFVVEAQAMISQQQQVEPADDNIPEEEQDNKQKVENQKRKIIINSDVDVAASITLSPRQKIADASDVHCSGSPLVTY